MADEGVVSVLLQLRYSADTCDGEMHHTSTLAATTFDEDDDGDNANGDDEGQYDALCAASLTQLCMPLSTPSTDDLDKMLPSKRPSLSSSRAGTKTPAAPAKVPKAANTNSSTSASASAGTRASFLFSSSEHHDKVGRKTNNKPFGLLEAAAAAAAAAAADPTAGPGTGTGQGRRGRYRCSKCGALKTNHECPIVEQYAVDFSAQATRIVLTPEEFDAAFITRDGEADGAAVQAAVGFAPGTFRVLRCKPLPRQQQQQQLQQQPLQSSSHASVVAAAVKAEAEDREEGTDSTDAASSPSSSSDATPPLTAAPASKAGGRAPTKASAR